MLAYHRRRNHHRKFNFMRLEKNKERCAIISQASVQDIDIRNTFLELKMNNADRYQH